MKKRVIFNALMFLLICFLGYILYTQIEEPIAFEAAKEERKKAVENQLIQIRKAQEAYRGITGNFAPDFTKLVDTLNYGRFARIQVFGDPDDPDNSDITYDTTYVAAIDSVKTMDLDLENIGVVPFSNGKLFDLETQIIDYQAAQVEVIRVSATWATFMGRFADPKFKKFDEKYDPNKRIGFGSTDKPILTGSWE